MNKPVHIPRQFDYRGLDKEMRSHLEKHAISIKKSLLSIKTSVVEVGRSLLEVRELLPRRFNHWVQSNCDFSVRTAELFMNSARFADEHKQLASKVSSTALYLLSAPRLDNQVRQRVVETIEKTGASSTNEIRDLLRREKALPTNGVHRDVKSEDDASSSIDELASILLGGLAETDLARVRTIVSAINTGLFPVLAAALNQSTVSEMQVDH
jgi:hypothetical protein